MARNSWFTPSRLEIINAVLIAVVSFATALAVWRTSVVGSNAGEESRLGLIEAVKKQALTNENVRKAYEEAAFGHQYAVYAAGVQVLEENNSPAASNLKQFLLPNLQLLGNELTSNPAYLKDDGTYDFLKRFEDMQDTPEMRALDPQKQFKRADTFYAEQRWLTIGSILLALSLFWLAVAEVSGERVRMWEILLGLGIFALGVLWFLGVEVFFLVMRGGL